MRLLTAAALLLAFATSFAQPADESAWHSALRQGDAEALGRLLDAVEDPDVGADSGRTALMVAAQRGDAALVERLIAAGADPNARNPNEGTPLMYAAAGGNPAVVRSLMAAGADVEARAKLGWTPLLVAAAKGRTAVVAALVEAGADPNARDVYGWTPLMRALHDDYPETAEVLLALPETDVDAAEESGNTALHMAAADGDTGAIGMLLARGASTSVRNHLDMTPRDVALSQGRQEAADMLGETESGSSRRSYSR